MYVLCCAFLKNRFLVFCRTIILPLGGNGPDTKIRSCAPLSSTSRGRYINVARQLEEKWVARVIQVLEKAQKPVALGKFGAPHHQPEAVRNWTIAQVRSLISSEYAGALALLRVLSEYFRHDSSVNWFIHQCREWNQCEKFASSKNLPFRLTLPKKISTCGRCFKGGPNL